MPRPVGLDPREPFTRAEALAAGITPWELRTPAYVRVYRNIYVSREATRTITLRSKAAIRVAPPGSLLAHHTAALLWGGAVPPTSAIHIRVPAGETLRVNGIRTHLGLGSRAVGRRHGLPLTQPEQTFLDLAEDLDLVDLVVLGDRFVRRNVTTPEALIQAAAVWRGPQAETSRRAAALVRAGVDSPAETRLRLMIVLAGIPEPTVNHILRDPDTGDWLRRFELAYEELRVAVEYEGRHHRDEDDVWASDIDRREELDRESWRIVQVISSGLFQNPLRTLQRIEQARIDRGAPPTRTFTEEWRRYFPGRDRL